MFDLPEKVRKKDCRAINPSDPRPNRQEVVREDSVNGDGGGKEKMVELKDDPEN